MTFKFPQFAFDETGYGSTPLEAFNSLVFRSYWRSVDSEWSYTISTKQGFVMVTVPEGTPIQSHIDTLMSEPGQFTSNGPAGCIEVELGEYIFFGLTGDSKFASPGPHN